MELILILTFVLLLPTLIHGECPAMKDIPVMWGDQFTCARKWWLKGDELGVNACNGYSDTYPDNHDFDAGDGNMIPMGSIFVKPGCFLYMFYNEEFGGDSFVIEGPAEIYENDWGHWAWEGGVANGPRSLKCRCIQEPVDCEPSDGYDVVLVCDNNAGQTSTRCSYSQTIGTQFSDSVSEGMSVDTTVEAEMAAMFWGLFSSGVGLSETTGYDWTETSEATKSEQVTVTVEAEAPPGLTLVIEQATGSCGDSEARTERFRTSHHDRAGEKIFSSVWEVGV